MYVCTTYVVICHSEFRNYKNYTLRLNVTVKAEHVLQCGALTLECVSTNCCNVPVEDLPKCHTVTHHALD